MMQAKLGKTIAGISVSPITRIARKTCSQSPPDK